MATPKEHGEIVLSAIFPRRFDLMEKAQMRLSPDHFVDPIQKSIFRLLERYIELTGQVMPVEYLDDLTNADAGTVLMLKEQVEVYVDRNVDDSSFLWSVESLREHLTSENLGEIMTNGMEILKTGQEQRTGEVLIGPEAAKEYLLDAIALLDKELATIDAPEGDLKDEYIQMTQDYADRKAALASGESRGILFGIENLDARVGGLQRGDLVMVAGYSSDGKSSLCVQLSWSAAVEQGKNVVIFTTETLRDQIRRKLIARHSKLPQFGLLEGLNTRDIKAGTLTPEQEESYKQVAHDLSNNKAYGHIYIVQVPRGATLSSIEQKMYRLQKKFPIDLVVMDYVALLSSTAKYGTVRETLSGILKECKQISTTFNDGQGVPFVSPWQVSRAARENAEKVGNYTSAALSETAEATNSPDVIISAFAPVDNTNRYTDINMQVLKNRDGETASNIVVHADYATCTFTSGSRGASAPISSATTSSNSSFELGNLYT